METHNTCQSVPQVKCSTTGAEERNERKMTELLEEKLIIQSCNVAENGGYCGEQKRKIAKKLKDAGLIRFEEVKGKCHRLRFLGFTAEGRKKYLDDSGNIKPEYSVEVEKQ